jgi:hypothetical protein
MKRFRFSLPANFAAKLFSSMAAAAMLLLQSVWSAPNSDSAPEAFNVGPAHSNSADIECVMPDGRLTPVLNVRAANLQAPALLTADNTISCDLQEGDTIFIIPVSKTALLDRFTFVNLNAAASGEFNIAISDSRLKPNSPGWVQVDGIVPFSHKRLFNLSLLGTGAKYVRLSFHVEKTNRLTRVSLNSGDTDRARIAAEPPSPAAGPNDD